MVNQSRYLSVESRIIYRSKNHTASIKSLTIFSIHNFTPFPKAEQPLLFTNHLVSPWRSREFLSLSAVDSLSHACCMMNAWRSIPVS